MKPGAVVPATIDFDGGGPPRSPAFGDVYHPREGAAGQARHVFLAGNGLPQRWQGREDFVIVETGFGLGSNFLATWQAWRDDPRRCARLHVVSLELHPPTRDDLLRAHAGTPQADLAQALARAWPPPTPDLHLLEFESGAVRLLLGLGDARRLLPRLRLRVDACYLDGFAPARNPQLWEPPLFKALARLAAPGATVATWSAARAVREGLQAAGFEVESAPGFGSKRDMTRARYAPRGGRRTAANPVRGSASAPSASPVPAADARHALIIGAGLAGASAASALARLGWRCTVLERHGSPAAEASGNPAGVFHPALHAADNPHARLLRAASLLAARRYPRLIEEGRVTGEVRGMLQMPGRERDEPRPHAEHPDIARLETAESAAGLTGLAAAGPGVHFGPAGWMAPGELVAAWLQAPGVTVHTGKAVASLERMSDGWRALDASGQALAQAPVVVLAAGTGLAALVQATSAEPLELGTSRGQLNWFDGVAGPRLPMTGQGYAVSVPGAGRVRLVFGATSHEGDGEPALREADTRWNEARLRALTGIEAAPQASLDGQVGGRVAWRVTTPDRLPVVGPLAAPDLPAHLRLDQARLVPRLTGVHVIGGLGSRGLTWAPLLGEVLAAGVAGTPQPLPSDLLDALDPARGLVRRVRRSQAARLEAKPARPDATRADQVPRESQAADGPG
ncbi:MAG: FAD-dependent 5-carboxymethylaminomethyl-2-thiouridine(34) oxidoreductase MnmC [Rubrivivax sp.]